MTHSVPSNETTTLPESHAKSVLSRGMIALVVGVAATAAAAFVDSKRFAFSYLTGVAWVTTIGLGALFFILVQHLTRAGWSVVARRHMEWISSVLPVCLALLAPFLVFGKEVFSHWLGEHAAHDPMIKKKASYLNPTFFSVRTVVFVAIWTALAFWFSKQSKTQDKSGERSLTYSMQRMSAPAILLFALSSSFWAFDWLMSLDPHWYSTIFGVYIFAGGLTSSLSALLLITVYLQARGYFKKVSTIEHQHDIGKLLFGFTVFWAYIAFSQFFLIWYANIPEETIFFKHRWEHNWKYISLLLLFGHFVIPFIALLSRTAKRSPKFIAIAATWMLVMHWIDLYWIVMPNYVPKGQEFSHFQFSWIDIASWMGPAGLLYFVITRKMAQGPLYPLKDPRLAETMRVENL